MNKLIHTIGHSTYAIEYFLSLLKQHKIDVVADVRSSPYSRINPQYNKKSLSVFLRKNAIKYVYLGDEFGACSSDVSCYMNSRVQYDLLAKTKLFQLGIKRIKRGAKRNYIITLICAEKDPLDCHRTILVAGNLEKEAFKIGHILSDGSIETQNQTTERILKRLKLYEADLFLTFNQRVEKAFKNLGQKIAFTTYIQTVQKKLCSNENFYHWFYKNVCL